MDQIFTLYLMAIDEESSPQLKVKKLGPGRYELDHRQILVRWIGLGGKRTPTEAQLLVRELPCNEASQEAGGEDVHEYPLDTYLQYAAQVASASRGNGSSAISRVPKEMRLTFSDVKGNNSHQLDIVDAAERCESMRKACEEARLREAAAAAYQGLRLAGAPPPVTMARSASPRAIGFGGFGTSAVAR